MLRRSIWLCSKNLPERKLPLSHSGLNGANKTRATDNLVSAWESLHCSLVALTNDALKTKCQPLKIDKMSRLTVLIRR